MKRYTFTLLTVVLFCISACDESCGECFTPPMPFTFELVNSNGENLFTKGVYTADQVEVTRLPDHQSFDFQFISENNLNMTTTNAIGWQSEEVGLSFSIDGNEIFTFSVAAQRVHEDCCSFTRYSDITLSGASYELNTQQDIYQVTISETL